MPHRQLLWWWSKRFLLYKLLLYCLLPACLAATSLEILYSRAAAHHHQHHHCVCKFPPAKTERDRSQGRRVFFVLYYDGNGKRWLRFILKVLEIIARAFRPTLFSTADVLFKNVVARLDSPPRLGLGLHWFLSSFERAPFRYNTTCIGRDGGWYW